MLGREKEEMRRIFIAIQSANVHLLNPDSYQAYQAALAATDGRKRDDCTEPVPEKTHPSHCSNGHTR